MTSNAIRPIRYQIHVEYNNGEPTSCVEANARRVSALKRAEIIRQTWKSAARVYIIDAATNKPIINT